MKFHPSPFKLRDSLHEIAGIRPKSGMVCRYHQIPCLARESGKPFHLFPARGRILARMGVRSAQDNRIPTIVRHHVPQVRNPFLEYIFHDMPN